MISIRTCLLLTLSTCMSIALKAQPDARFQWLADGSSFLELEEGQLVRQDLRNGSRNVVLNREALLPSTEAGDAEGFSYHEASGKLLVFANTARVWRYNTRGDYWLVDTKTGQRRKLGASLPAKSMMFAKFSPAGDRIAYVSRQNLYVEDLVTGQIRQLSFSEDRKLINGTFDWVYEEEFACRDGFRWSPDGKAIAFWEVDARPTADFYMINNTDSVYAKLIPVEYPKVGQPPSRVRIGVITTSDGKTTWMQVPGDPGALYLPRMEWLPAGNQLIVQQLSRKQNESSLYICQANTGTVKRIMQENDSAWIDILPSWDDDYSYGGWDWLGQGKEFIWASEKDGWRHLYRVESATGKERLLTAGSFDVLDIVRVDEKSGYLYYMASPGDALRRYLYRSRLDGKGSPERLTPQGQQGWHSYQLAPGAGYARNNFSNASQPPATTWIRLPEHAALPTANSKPAAGPPKANRSTTEFFQVLTEEGVSMDGWMVLPRNFDSTKKYPVVFYVYTEPAAQTVSDRWGTGRNFLYAGDMAADGYIQISIDNRGTPAGKGRAWRKSIYRKIGRLNIRDQAMAARALLRRPYMDTARVAVWGWSGGGSATLNLLFQFPEIYKTGISIAAVANQLTYDNIYQERYMGLPSENREDFIAGSPMTHAAGLRGKLLYIHGTGDDNVHYQNAEMLVNELIRHGKLFQFMPYPNRSHGIYEGEGTFTHLQKLYTSFLREHCPPGAR